MFLPFHWNHFCGCKSIKITVIQLKKWYIPAKSKKSQYLHDKLVSVWANTQKSLNVKWFDDKTTVEIITAKDVWTGNSRLYISAICPVKLKVDQCFATRQTIQLWLCPYKISEKACTQSTKLWQSLGHRGLWSVKKSLALESHNESVSVKPWKYLASGHVCRDLPSLRPKLLTSNRSKKMLCRLCCKSQL